MMQKQGGGVIVNLVAAIRDSQDWNGQAAFAASQAGLVGLTRQAARELADDHVRLNAICLEQLFELPSPDDLKPLVEQVVFLCSNASRDITGQILDVKATGNCKICRPRRKIITHAAPEPPAGSTQNGSYPIRRLR